MSMHPYIAEQLARSRQEELHRLAIRPSRALHRDPALRGLRSLALRVLSPRPDDRLRVVRL